MEQTSDGVIAWGSDFAGKYADVTWGTGTVLIDGLGFVSVNEGSFGDSTTLSGGVIDITTDTGDDDNACFVGMAGIPQEGGLTVEARWQITNLDCAVYLGFTQTLSMSAPVMPAEFATATMTYNGTGAMVGFNYDVDGTTDDYRALMGTGGAGVNGSSTTGIRANVTTTVSKWVTGKVNLFSDGGGECWLSDVGHQDKAGMPILRLIKRWPGTEQGRSAAISTTAVYFPFLMIENRSGNARHLYVDYFRGRSFRNHAF